MPFHFCKVLQPYCSCFGLRELVSYCDKFGGLSCSSAKFTSFRLYIHSLYSWTLLKKGIFVYPKICPIFIFTLILSSILSINFKPDYIWFFWLTHLLILSFYYFVYCFIFIIIIIVYFFIFLFLFLFSFLFLLSIFFSLSTIPIFSLHLPPSLLPTVDQSLQPPPTRNSDHPWLLKKMSKFLFFFTLFYFHFLFIYLVIYLFIYFFISFFLFNFGLQF